MNELFGFYSSRVFIPFVEKLQFNVKTDVLMVLTMYIVLNMCSGMCHILHVV